jgi:sortase B
MKNIIISALLTICIIATVFFGWNIYIYYQDLHKTTTYSSQFVSNARVSAIESPVNYDEMYSQNHDYRGWIWFDNDLISQPIVQADENNKYLRRNLEGDYSLAGTPFIDAANSLTDQNITIYGHNMLTGDPITKTAPIFAPLCQLIDQSTYDQNKRFYIDWQDGVKTYQIFAVCVVDPEESSWNYTQNIFQTDHDFYDFIHEAKKNSSISADVDICATDKLITLQTCIQMDTLQRAVIIAKEIKQ